MSGRQKTNEKGKREPFLFFKFLEPSFSLYSLSRTDECVCWMMELFSLGGGFSPRL